MNKGSFRIFRHVKEGMSHLTRNSWMTLISLISVMVTLLIVGVFTTVIMNVSNMTKGVEKDIEAVVYIDVKATDVEISQLRDQIKSNKDVLKVDYVNKDRGLKELMESLGESGKAFESLKKDNPLNDAFMVKAKDPRKTENIANEIAKMNLVDDVQYGEGYVKKLLSVTEVARNIGLVLIIGLVLTALLLIANTIKMTIEMRKEEIKIMKLVGATNFFIRTPFVIEGALLGVAGAILPVTAIAVSYMYVVDAVNSANKIKFVELLSVYDVVMPVSVLLIGLSLIIGMVGSAISIRRYLKV